MKNNELYMLIGVVIAAILLIYVVKQSGGSSYPAPKEHAKLGAYHFGFPTHGSYNWGGGPLKGLPYLKSPWMRFGYGYPRNYHWNNPYGYGSYGYGPKYYRRYIKPYLTGTCYSSSETDGCRVGYSKTRKDSDGDGDVDEHDEWLCCRDRDMF